MTDFHRQIAYVSRVSTESICHSGISLLLFSILLITYYYMSLCVMQTQYMKKASASKKVPSSPLTIHTYKYIRNGT